MNIVRIKPTEQGTVRIALDLTRAEIKRAQTYRPAALNHQPDPKLCPEYSVNLTNDEGYLGARGLNVPAIGKASEKVEFVVTLDKKMSEDEAVTLITNAISHLTAIEKQIKDANTAFAADAAKIETI